jgi:hypothetical protein
MYSRKKAQKKKNNADASGMRPRLTSAVVGDLTRLRADFSEHFRHLIFKGIEVKEFLADWEKEDYLVVAMLKQ